MAKTVARLRIDFDVNGDFSQPDTRKAILEAQSENSKLLEDRVKMLAAGEKKGYSNRDRNQGNYPGPMEEYYNAQVQPNGDLVLDNPTLRANIFELGAEPHEIWASGPFAHGQRRPPRGSRGQFSRGKRALSFDFIGGGHFVGEMVEHPGQDANPVMERAMSESLDLMADNVGRAIAAEVAHG